MASTKTEQSSCVLQLLLLAHKNEVVLTHSEQVNCLHDSGNEASFLSLSLVYFNPN